MSIQIVVDEHLSPELANMLLQGMPEKIRLALEARAKAMDYPVWTIIEMAIAGCVIDHLIKDTF